MTISPRVLVAGIGNMFRTDDGFGCEVVRRLAAHLRRRLTDDQIRAAVGASLSGDFDAPEVAGLSAAQSDCAKRAAP